MALQITVFYVDRCSYCIPVKKRMAELAKKHNFPLDVRKPRNDEAEELNLPGYPSILIPAKPVNVILNGADSVEAFEKMLPLLKVVMVPHTSALLRCIE